MKIFGKWHVTNRPYKDSEYADQFITEGYQRIKFSLPKKTVRIIRELISPCSPDKTDEKEERIIDLVVDVWGMAGPDCRTGLVKSQQILV